MRFTFKKRNLLSVLIVAVIAVVAMPMLLFPIGYGRGINADFLVNQAYAAVFPTDPNAEVVLVEDYAIAASSLEGENLDSETDTGAVLGEGQTVKASYFDEAIPLESYDDVFTASVVRYYDEGDVPVEILDEATFTSASDRTNYIQTVETIIKEEPIMSSRTLTKINKMKAVTRVSDGDSWSLIRTEDGTEGYVPTYCLSETMVFVNIDRTVWVKSSDGLTLRAGASTDSDFLGTLGKDEKLRCTEVADKWYKVTTEDGVVGYVASAYTTETPPPTPTPIPTPTSVPFRPQTGNNGGGAAGNGGGGGSSGGGGGESSSGGGGGNPAPPAPTITGVNGDSIRSICESMLGVPYVWAGESKNGVDCSGLVVYAYRQLGVSLPHLADSLKSVGVAVDRSSIAVGDIVCWSFNGSSYASHAGIYVGGGQVIHASASGGNVRYGSVDMGTIVGLRRVIQ